MFRKDLACEQCNLCRFLSWFRLERFFSLEEALLWIMNSYFSKKQCFELSKVLIVEGIISRYKLMDWTGVDYCDVFISCLDSHSDGTHSLQSIHWWTVGALQNFSKSVWMKKKLIYIQDNKCSFLSIKSVHNIQGRIIRFSSGYF